MPETDMQEVCVLFTETGMENRILAYGRITVQC